MNRQQRRTKAVVTDWVRKPDVDLGAAVKGIVSELKADGIEISRDAALACLRMEQLFGTEGAAMIQRDLDGAAEH